MKNTLTQEKYYGLNLSRFEILLKKFGVQKLKKKKVFNSQFYDAVEIFLKINLEKKENKLKTIVYNKNFKIENGSLRGYRYYRGLPIYNQRTKTNAKTSKKVY